MSNGFIYVVDAHFIDKIEDSVGHRFYQYQQNEQSPLILTKLTEHKKEPRDMTLEIQGMSWDRHKHVT
jgi:hypothetical protein